MPVRSLRSCVLKWPDAQAVTSALREWAREVSALRPEVLRIGYFGSYARGDWGVGSDLDLILVVASAPEPFIRRAASWDLTGLPVPADLLVYTAGEWEALAARQGFSQTLRREVIWLYERASVEK